MRVVRNRLFSLNLSCNPSSVVGNGKVVVLQTSEKTALTGGNGSAAAVFDRFSLLSEIFETNPNKMSVNMLLSFSYAFTGLVFQF